MLSGIIISQNKKYSENNQNQYVKKTIHGAMLLVVGMIPARVMASADPTVSYCTHIQNIRCEADTSRGWKSNDDMSGTEGLSYRLEAIQIKLTGSDADKLDIYY